MRLWVLAVADVLVLGGSLLGMAQQQTGPRTFESLLNSDEATKPAAVAEVDFTDTVPKRPAGTVARPEDGVQHPDLDKAWADYEAAVTKAAEGIRAAINKQFDAATEKGDLDAAEKWQNALEKFEKAGKVPAEKEVKAAVSGAIAELKKAGEELTKAYEAVVKALTIEKRIAEAKAVRQENQSLGKAPEEQTSPVVGAKSASTEKTATPRRVNEKAVRQQIVAAFVGPWRHESGVLEEMRADGDYVVDGNIAHPWAGKWVLDLDDPRGPCAVRHANNGQKTRWYVDPANRDRLWSGNGTSMKRE